MTRRIGRPAPKGAAASPFSSRFIATPFKVVDGCVKITRARLPNPAGVKVNKGSQLRTNEQGPQEGRVFAPPSSEDPPLVYLSCQVKGSLGEGETLFFFSSSFK